MIKLASGPLRKPGEIADFPFWQDLHEDVMVGQTILHYKILEKLGEGGMGVVYKAEDTKLDRPVAIKFLPAQLLASADDRLRFHREAKAAASLSHPHIATVYEISEFEEKPFIVMEYVEGKTLNDLLKGELFNLHDVVSIAIQIADGLKAAHAKNIVHRDIKCANILLSASGQVKILDFGLAKTTMSTKLTKAGSTLGTVGYMSPEQVGGQPVDHRTDLWSLGVVLFEMVTGRLPFAGDYDQVIFYTIMNTPVEPLTSIRSGVPMSLEWIVNKLLAKSPDERYQNANDAIIDLRAVDTQTGGVSRTVHPSAVRSDRAQLSSSGMEIQRGEAPIQRKRLVSGITLFLFGAGLATVILWNLRPLPSSEVRKYTWPSENEMYALSPDGKKIAWCNGNQLWIRFLDKTEPVVLKRDHFIGNILWSPSSDYVAYWMDAGLNARHELRKVTASGVGDVLLFGTEDDFYPRFWGVDDSILVNTWDNADWNTRLKVPSSGGELTPICGGDSAFCRIKGNLTHVAALPDGKTILLSTTDYAGKYEISLQTPRERHIVYSVPEERFSGARPEYSNTGHILFPLSSGENSVPDLWAIPFDVSSMLVTGNRFLVVRSAAQFSISDNGMLLYVEKAEGTGEQLVLLSRSGTIVRTLTQPQKGEIHSPSISPDGNTVAAMNGEGNDIWLYDLTRGNKSQLSYDVPQTWRPSWSPDGKELVFQSGYGDSSDIYLQATNGISPAIPLIHTPQFEGAPCWSGDGRFIFYVRLETQPRRQTDIWYLDVRNKTTPKPLFESRFSESFPCGSPDGRFVTYVSDKSGQPEVYVTEFPNAQHQWQISIERGMYPQWVGDEVFFLNPLRNELMTAPVDTRPEFRPGNPE